MNSKFTSESFYSYLDCNILYFNNFTQEQPKKVIMTSIDSTKVLSVALRCYSSIYYMELQKKISDKCLTTLKELKQIKTMSN